MNVVTALRPSDPVTSTENRPSRSEPGKSRLTAKRTEPSRPVTGLTRAVRSNVSLGNCGGLFQISETVTGVCAAKPLPWTTQAVLTVPRLWVTMHSTGSPAWPDSGHTVGGGRRQIGRRFRGWRARAAERGAEDDADHDQGRSDGGPAGPGHVRPEP